MRLERRDREWAFGTVATSRYTRLGGADIDRAVAHEVLLPQVAEAAECQVSDLDADQRDEIVERLTSIADDLKQKLVAATNRQVRMGGNPQNLVVRVPRKITIPLGDGRSSIFPPALSRHEFDEVLAPFLDRDRLHAMRGEFFDSQSIFAPLTDVIERASLEARAP